jgi:hypothetical protein
MRQSEAIRGLPLVQVRQVRQGVWAYTGQHGCNRMHIHSIFTAWVQSYAKSTAWVRSYAYSLHGCMCHQCHQMPSDAIRCHHVRVRTLYRIDAARRTNDKRVPHGIVRIAGQRLRHRGERLRLVLGCEAHLMREAIRRTQTHSDALRRSQTHSDDLRRSQMQSLAISASALSSPAR